MNMLASAQETIKHWGYITAHIHVPRNKKDYEQMLAFVDELMDLSERKTDPRITTLLEFLAEKISTYEKQHYHSTKTTPIEILAHLMEEHNLRQSDLSELGSQSLVSKILKGERKLTVEQISKLAKRFHVSPAIFYPN